MSETRHRLLDPLRGWLPTIPYFERWLKRTGELPPDFGELPLRYEAEDPLEGVTTAAQWPARRREIAGRIEHWLLGTAPPPPDNLEELSRSTSVDDGRECHVVELGFGPGHACRLQCWFFPPRASGRRPVFLVDGHRHSSWARDAYERHGFGICVYRASDPAYWNKQRDPSEAWSGILKHDDWSAFRRRGWGASRALDWLIRQEQVDPERVSIGGHSRSAKQALAAAAFDTRFAGILSSSPGSGGSLSFRSGDAYTWSESVEILTNAFPDWIHPRARFFAGRESRYPADPHLLLALMAPRPLLVSFGIWDNVESSWIIEESIRLTRGVYRLLDAERNLGVLYRDGTHTIEDLQACEHSRFMATATGVRPTTVGEAFAHQPLHPWDADSADREDSGSLRAGAPAASRPVAERAEWLLGEGPAYQPLPVRFGQDEPAHVRVRLGRDGPEYPARVPCLFGQQVNGVFHFPGRNDYGSGANLPVVVWLPALHCSKGYATAYLNSRPPQDVLRRAGYAVFCHDLLGTGDRQHERRGFFERHRRWSLLGKMVLDARHAVDAAVACADVDATRIFIAGFGLGAEVALLAAALDKRIAGVCCYGGLTPWRAASPATGTLARWWKRDGFLPRLRCWQDEPGQTPLDVEDLLCEVCPRPALLIAPTYDRHCEHAALLRQVAAAAAAYRAAGVPGALEVVEPDDYGRMTDSGLGQMVAWLECHAGR